MTWALIQEDADPKVPPSELARPAFREEKLSCHNFPCLLNATVNFNLNLT